ncbi:hypothetical protein CKAH01_15529 [Colletotrichum kahawae]|uniref:Uncharacterized protein n=1 Tax=Colletotrichum kahawae TaxID=34407 RepID=A0AAD9YIU7_COLKA|nr:hypothetical protein CKAH01_15529 [Colletotrichum kahawae]
MEETFGHCPGLTVGMEPADEAAPKIEAVLPDPIAPHQLRGRELPIPAVTVIDLKALLYPPNRTNAASAPDWQKQQTEDL